MTGPGYPYFLGADWDRGYRSQRIRDLIAAEGELSVPEMAAPPARRPATRWRPTLVPYLLDVEDLGSPYYRGGQELLERVGLPAAGRQCGGGLLQRGLGATSSRLTFHDELRESLWPDGGDRWFGVVEGLLGRPVGPLVGRPGHRRRGRDPRRHPAPGDARRPRRADPARGAATPRGGPGARCTGSTCAARPWASRASAPIEWLMNREGYQVGGGSSIVDATGWDAVRRLPGGHRRRRCGWWSRSHDFDDSRWINLTGVSGHPFDDHYVDQTELCRGRGHAAVGLLPRGRRSRPGSTPSRWSRPSSPPGRLGPSAQPGDPRRRRGGQHRPVVRLDRHVHADLLVVEQHAGEGADRHPGQRPVVAAAAPGPAGRRPAETASPGTSTTSAVATASTPSGGRDRLEQPEAGRGQRLGPGVDGPVQVEVAGPSRRRSPAGAPACRRRAARRGAGRCRARRPTETYAATVAARRTSGAASRCSAMARRRRRPPRPAGAGCGR